MHYGAMNSPLKPIVAEIDGLAALGVDYLELTLDAPQAHHSLIRDQQTIIRQRLRHHGLGLVCHMPTFVYTADLTPAIRQASLAEVLHSLEVAAELEAAKIVLHPSMISGLGHLVQADAVAHALESLATILERAARLGQCICLENMMPSLGYMVEPHEFTPLFDTYGELKLTLDMGHAFIGARTADRIFDFLERFPDRLQHVHVSDNGGLRDDHLPLGQGSVPFGDVLPGLKACGYDGTITLEIFSENRRDWLAGRDFLEVLFAGAD